MGQEWDVGQAVHMTFDPHSHRVPCPVPAPGGPSHPVRWQPPPQPLPSHHLPSILLTEHGSHTCPPSTPRILPELHCSRPEGSQK